MGRKKQPGRLRDLLDRIGVPRPGQPALAIRTSAEEKPMGSSLPKVNRLLYEVIRFGHMDHRSEEATLAVLALELTLASCDRNGRVASALILIPDHARQIENDLCPMGCPRFSKSLLKEEFIVRIHRVYSS
jgi:hypothetical protein